MNKPKIIHVDDRKLCDLVKKEAKRRGVLYFPFATECLRVGYQTIKESSKSSHPAPQTRDGDYSRF